MKKIFLILCMSAAAATVFATGAQEADEDGVVKLQPRELARNSYLEDLEQAEVTGTVKFESPVPELVAGGKSYTLIAPGAMAFYDYVSEGDKITVKGYIVDEETMPWNAGPAAGPGGRGRMFDLEALEGNIELLVESVEIDGTTYQLPWVDNETGFGRMADKDGMFGRGGMSSRDDNRMYGGKADGRQRPF